MTAGEIEWELGDWTVARSRAPAPHRGHSGTTLMFVALRRAEIALADGDDARALRAAGARRGPACWRRGSRSSSAGTGTCGRRSRGAAATRSRRARAIDDALDAIEFCSEDRPRIARLAQTGVSVEADAAERARDIGDGDAERAGDHARGDVPDARRGVRRPAAAGRGRAPRDRRGRAGARARRAAIPGRSPRPPPRGDAARRPYPAALAQLARAEALAAAGDRDGGAGGARRRARRPRGAWGRRG